MYTLILARGLSKKLAPLANNAPKHSSARAPKEQGFADLYSRLVTLELIFSNPKTTHVTIDPAYLRSIHDNQLTDQATIRFDNLGKPI
jgi:hypothetical protein